MMSLCNSGIFMFTIVSISLKIHVRCTIVFASGTFNFFFTMHLSHKLINQIRWEKTSFPWLDLNSYS